MELFPSVMCADLGHLAREIRELEAAGADGFHCDVMDGDFVPNICLGLSDIRTVRGLTEKPIDVHLMVRNPFPRLDYFIDAGADIVYVHPEAEPSAAEALGHIRSAGRKAGLAVNPETTVLDVEALLPLVDYLMVMTVTPGFAGQPFLDSTLPKIGELARLKDRYGYRLVIDGACSPERIVQLSPMGADVFVLGTSALFGKGDYADTIRELHGLHTSATAR